MGQGTGQKDLAAATGTYKQYSACAVLLTTCTQRQGSLGFLLSDDELIKPFSDSFRSDCWRARPDGNTAPAFLLVDDGLAKLDASTADVDIPGTFDQRADIPIVFAAEGAISGTVLHGATQPKITI